MSDLQVFLDIVIFKADPVMPEVNTSIYFLSTPILACSLVHIVQRSRSTTFGSVVEFPQTPTDDLRGGRAVRGRRMSLSQLAHGCSW